MLLKILRRFFQKFPETSDPPFQISGNRAVVSRLLRL